MLAVNCHSHRSRLRGLAAGQRGNRGGALVALLVVFVVLLGAIGGVGFWVMSDPARKSKVQEALASILGQDQPPSPPAKPEIPVEATQAMARGEAYLDGSEFDKAEDAARRALGLLPETETGRARDLLTRIRERRAAAEAAEQAKQREVQEKLLERARAEAKREGQIGSARMLIQGGDFANAKRVLEQVLKDHPDDPQALRLLNQIDWALAEARIQEELERLKAAQAAAQTAGQADRQKLLAELEAQKKALQEKEKALAEAAEKAKLEAEKEAALRAAEQMRRELERLKAAQEAEKVGREQMLERAAQEKALAEAAEKAKRAAEKEAALQEARRIQEELERLKAAQAAAQTAGQADRQKLLAELAAQKKALQEKERALAEAAEKAKREAEKEAAQRAAEQTRRELERLKAALEAESASRQDDFAAQKKALEQKERALAEAAEKAKLEAEKEAALRVAEQARGELERLKAAQEAENVGREQMLAELERLKAAQEAENASRQKRQADFEARLQALLARDRAAAGAAQNARSESEKAALQRDLARLREEMDRLKATGVAGQAERDRQIAALEAERSRRTDERLADILKEIGAQAQKGRLDQELAAQRQTTEQALRAARQARDVSQKLLSRQEREEAMREHRGRIVETFGQLGRAYGAAKPDSFERLLSAGFQEKRADEVENVRRFFALATNVKYDHRILPDSVTLDGQRATAASDWTVRYEIGGEPVSLSFHTTLKLVLEDGTWKIDGWQTEELLR